MLPWVIEVIVNVIPPCTVADPFPIGVDVGGLGMALFIGKCRVFRLRMRGSYSGRSMGRDIAASNPVTTSMLLGKNR
jgi:hypothetical protein